MTTKIQSPVSIIPLPDAVGWEWQNTYPEFPGVVYRHLRGPGERRPLGEHIDQYTRAVQV